MMLYWLIILIYYVEHTKHQDTYGMNYGLRQRNAGYWQLSKRVHNTKELELSGKGQITPDFDCLRYVHDYKTTLKTSLHIFFSNEAKTNATSRLGYPVGRYKWLIDYEPKCDIFEPTNVTLTLSRCDQVRIMSY